jgi:2-pyrone-4,6-dicarboxylate lactonase
MQVRPVDSMEHCLPPPNRYTSPVFKVPALACDSHFHVTPKAPWCLAPDASYSPALAPSGQAKAMRSALGLSRGLVVQPSIFGTDNRGVLEALASDPDHLRGVAVADRSVGDTDLERWHSLGVRGLRFITSGLGAASDIADMIALAPRIRLLGWHMEIQPLMDQWAELAAVLHELPVTLVIDHMGNIPAEVDQNHESLQVVHSLVKHRGAHVKLIGYRLSNEPHDRRLIHRAHRFFEDAPRQMVWGTDWPHVVRHPMTDTGTLLNEFGCWFDNDIEVLERVLTSNPASLFGFQSLDLTPA